MERIIKLSSPKERALVEEFYEVRKKYQEHVLFLKEKHEQENIEVITNFNRMSKDISRKIFDLAGIDQEVLDDPNNSITLFNRFMEHGNAYMVIQGIIDPETEEPPTTEYEAVDHSEEFNKREQFH